MPVGKLRRDAALERSPVSQPLLTKATSTVNRKDGNTQPDLEHVINTMECTDSRPHIQVTLEGRTFLALIDTGAVIDLIGNEVATFLEENGYTSHESAMHLRMADGSNVITQQEYGIVGQVANRWYSWNAVYVPTLTTNLIFGMNSILKLQLLKMDPAVQVKTREPGSYTEIRLDAVSTLTAAQQHELRQFLDVELPRFDVCPGQTKLVTHTIRLKEKAIPIKQRHYPRNPAMQAVLLAEVDKMLQEGVIEPSTSPWSSPVVLIKKPTGKFRFCLDLRRVNTSSVKDAYPLPRINSILEKLRHASYISSLDLKNGYWQVPLSPDSRAITAFTVPGVGLFQFKVMPFGLHSAPATFQRLLDQIIGADLDPHAFAYLDDLILVSDSFEEHLALLKLVFERLLNAGLRINPEKCKFCRTELVYLGHVVNGEGISTDPEKVKAIQEFPRPHNLKSLRGFLGLASWYRRFVTDFAKIIVPLRNLLKKNAKWDWKAEHENAFVRLKELLSSTPVLTCPDFTEPFTIQTDASNEGLGASLTQRHSGREVVIAYASRLLSDREKHYTTTEKECLALVWAVRKFRPYTEGYHFVAITDHVALKWLLQLKEPSGRLARWVMELQQHDMEIQYRKGTLNRVADALSRNPIGYHSQPVTVMTRSQARERSRLQDRRSQNREEGDTTPEVLPHPLLKPSANNQNDEYDSFRDQVLQNPGKNPRYHVQAGKLYRIFYRPADPSTQVAKLYVAPNDIPKVLVECHDSPTAGHLGVKKTIARVGERYYWPEWRRQTKNYVRSCLTCQQYKSPQVKPPGKMYFRHSRGPWYQISGDLVGPFPRSAKGNKYLIVFQDQFSKWTELAPLRDATAQAVANRLKELILCRYGAPEILLSDNGSQFVSRIMADVASHWGIEHRTTAPYSPQSNPVERQNRVIKTIISQFVKNDHRKWDAQLGDIQFALNSAVHDSTQFTPAQLCLGRELKVPRAVGENALEGTPYERDERLIESQIRRRRQYKLNYEACQRNLKRAFERQAKYYNAKRRTLQFQPGDMVLRRQHVLSSAQNAFVGKLAPKFVGPFKIQSRIAANMYLIKDSITNQTSRVHVKDIKLFVSRDNQ